MRRLVGKLVEYARLSDARRGYRRTTFALKAQKKFPLKLLSLPSERAREKKRMAKAAIDRRSVRNGTTLRCYTERSSYD